LACRMPPWCSRPRSCAAAIASAFSTATSSVLASRRSVSKDRVAARNRLTKACGASLLSVEEDLEHLRVVYSRSHANARAKLRRRWSQIHARTSATKSARPRSVMTVGRPPGSRSAAARRALGDNVLSAPRKRECTVVCRVLSHLAPPCIVAPAAWLLSPPVLPTPAVPCFLPPHLPSSPRAQTPPTSCSHHVLHACHRSLALLRRCQPLERLAGLCLGAHAGAVPSQPPRPPGGLLHLFATLSRLLARHTSPCTRPGPNSPPSHLARPRHAPRSASAPSSGPLFESPA